MKTIPLTNSAEATLVDDEIYSLAIQHNPDWYLASSGVYTRSLILPKSLEKDGFRGLRERATRIALHRLVLNVHINCKSKDVDHIDGNKLNNQKSNLRLCEHYENLHNVGKTGQGITSKYKGVSWHIKSGKWMVLLCVNGERIYGGLFVNEIDAAIASNNLMLKHIGKFAKLNII